MSPEYVLGYSCFARVGRTGSLPPSLGGSVTPGLDPAGVGGPQLKTDIEPYMGAISMDFITIEICSPTTPVRSGTDVVPKYEPIGCLNCPMIGLVLRTCALPCDLRLGDQEMKLNSRMICYPFAIMVRDLVCPRTQRQHHSAGSINMWFQRKA